VAERSIDSVTHRKPGDLLDVYDFNAVVDAVKKKLASPFGIQVGGNIAIADQRLGQKSYEHEVYSDAEDIPPWSVFGISSLPDQDVVAGSIPRFSVVKLGTNGGNAGQPFTNGQSGIPYKGFGTARPLYSAVLVRLQVTGTLPNAGQFCGVVLDTYGVGTESVGLLCVASETGQDDGNSYAYCVSALAPGAILGEVAETITGFNSSTMTLGHGKVKVQFKDSSDDLYAALDPSVPASGGSGTGDWELPVYSADTDQINAGSVVICESVAGIGLMAIKLAVEGSSASEGCVKTIGGVFFGGLPSVAMGPGVRIVVVDANNCLGLVGGHQCP
jgi:hypothetical protein